MVISSEKSTSAVGKEFNIIQLMVSEWFRRYNEGEIESLENQRKQGNPLTKYSRRKEYEIV